MKKGSGASMLRGTPPSTTYRSHISDAYGTSSIFTSDTDIEP